ncbi:MAG: Trm112 family protein [Woeseiaceae bacterium]|jgi:uncharacterized protein YbaR (Trm112 family)|nr:Trm112 family protein [Woeseiaceae bacterium]
MQKNLLTILRCPVSHKGLAVMRADRLRQLNSAIAGGDVRNRDGQPVTDPLDEALVTDDGKLGYPVADGIPVLLEGAAIQLSQID